MPGFFWPRHGRSGQRLGAPRCAMAGPGRPTAKNAYQKAQYRPKKPSTPYVGF